MINAITFNGQNVTSANDAVFHNSVGADDRIVRGCAISTTPSSITVQSGYFFAAGREIQVSGDETTSIAPAPVDTPSYFVFEIDMDASTRAFKVITTTPVHDDINSGSGKYQLVFATFTNGLSGLTDFSEVIGRGEYQSLAFTNVSVATSAFVEDATYEDYGYRADIECEGVTDSYFATVVFDPAEADSGMFASVCNAGNDIVTIYATDVPDSAITIPTISAVMTKAVTV